MERQTKRENLLNKGESTGGYIITGRLPVNASESEIYLCRQNDKTYICKYYYREHTKPEVLKILGGIKSGYITEILNYGIHKDRYFEILQYIEDGSLGEKNNPGHYKYLPFSEADTIEIAAKVNEGLNVLHNHGIIHRDLKPENILYRSRDKSVLISDFGFSSRYDLSKPYSSVETRARTEGYAGPEIYSYMAGPKTDYYSLGITVWRICTAKEPFINFQNTRLAREQIEEITRSGEIINLLFEKEKNLSNKIKELITGLLLPDYNARWGYTETGNFVRHDG